jgi:HD-GYP domain-containing protein (c-di-GMP phosphodiesterase class II)
MRLAVDVRHPRNGSRLLSESFELDEHLIDKLFQLRVHEVWIDYPGTEDIKKYLSPFVVAHHGEMVATIADIFDGVHRDAFAKLDFTSYRRTLRDLIEALISDPTSSAYIVEMGGESSNALRHAAEVCFLSLLLGLKLQGYLIEQRKRLRPADARNVTSLGLGSMLHDIGLKLVEPEVRERYERTRDETDAAWRRHVLLGHHLVTGAIAPAAAGIVLHHHQHFDGSGFPTRLDEDGKRRGLIGDEIHVFARIVCVANNFDRLRRQPDGFIVPRVRVMRKMLCTSLARRFDPVVLAALPLVVPAYPPGTVVRLNTGEQAMVSEWHPESPCQPTVLVGQHGEGPARFTNPVRYDLRELPELLIIEQDGLDVSRDNFRMLTDPSEVGSAA